MKENAPPGASLIPASAWALLAGLVAAWLAVVLLAPEEVTLGGGIRIVYVHVALIWAGMAGLLLAGGLGGLALWRSRPRVYRWMTVVAWVGLLLFGAGVGTSLIAEIVNWGGIAWNEPRTAANLNLLAGATIAQVIASWIDRPRPAALLNIAVAAAVVWTTVTTELQLHPADPVGGSGSAAIQLTFYGLFALTALVGAWLIWAVNRRMCDPTR